MHRIQNETSLEAATEWLLTEACQPSSFEPITLEGLRLLASKELARPRDSLHLAWSRVFLDHTDRYFK